MNRFRRSYHAAHNWLKAQGYLDTWTFWHLLWGMIGARVGLAVGLSPLYAFLAVWSVAWWWEIFELVWVPPQSYGGYRPWLRNSLADIFVAVLGAALVVF